MEDHTGTPLPRSQTAPPGSKNGLALVSFFTGVSWPILLGLAVFAAKSNVSTSIGIIPILSVLGSLAVPTTIGVAIATGHIALARAKRYEPGNARRGFAIPGLVLGYLGATVIVVVIVIAIVAEAMLAQVAAPTPTP